jgi:aspartate kinase
MISQSSSEQSICFVVPQMTADTVIDAVNREFETEIGRRDIDEVFSQDAVGIVTVVGGGMREVPGVAGKIFSATGAHSVNVIAITQGSSECSISLVVAAGDVDRAVHAIHPLTMAS